MSRIYEIADKYVDELRQFIDPQMVQKCADPRAAQ